VGSPTKRVECNITQAKAHFCSLPNFHFNAVNQKGDTPLHLTIKGITRHDNDPLPTLQYLLNHPFIIVNYRNVSGNTPLDVAQTMIENGRNHRNELRTMVSFFGKLRHPKMLDGIYVPNAEIIGVLAESGKC
jgi:hypothetical protein